MTACSRTARRRSRCTATCPCPHFRVIDGRRRARDRDRAPAPALRPRAVQPERPAASRSAGRRSATSRSLAVRRGRAGPRRHRPHARRRRRPHPAGERRRLAQGRRRRRRLAHRSLFTDDGWVSPRDGERTDLYVFAYGARLRRGAARALRRVRLAAGAAALGARQLVEPLPPLHRRRLPRAARPLRRARACRSRSPCSTWTGTGSTASRPSYGGWTGYSWEPELFPDPEALPRRGAPPRPEGHAEPPPRRRACAPSRTPTRRWPRRSAATPSWASRSRSTSTTPPSSTAYFEVLHHPLEEQGVDFWWMDWQQGPHSRITGIDPLWMLNHFHFLDAGRDGERPLLLRATPGRAATATRSGSRATCISAGTRCDFQPEFTATASNIGYGWWSHDIGGHMFGARDDELTARWVQLGVFSPILRLHSIDNPFLAKEPWAFPAETRAALGDALRLRVRLVPYLHTMNHRARPTAIPLVLPMYYLAPERPRGLRGPEPVPLRQRAARRADHLAARPGHAARTRHGVAAAGRGPTSSPAPSTRRPHDRAAPRRATRSRCCCAPAASCRWPARTTRMPRPTPLGSNWSSPPAPTARSPSSRTTAPAHGGRIPSVRTTIRWSRRRRARRSARRRPGRRGPAERTWTVTFLGLEGEPVTVADAPTAARSRSTPRPTAARGRPPAPRRCSPSSTRRSTGTRPRPPRGGR